MWLSWQQALWLAATCAIIHAAFGRIVTRFEQGRWRRSTSAVSAVAGEAGLVALLYGIWQYVFSKTVTRTAGALDHAQWIYEFEQTVRLPSEVTVQRWSMHSSRLIETLNTYYAYVHIPALGLMLAWVFFAHRDHYAPIRNTLALSTASCLILQAIPVAPPRFLPGLGFVDTGLLYGQSVYGEGGSGISNQLAAMPSVHVLWATLVAGAVIWVATSPWRWIVLIHPVVTVWAVVATANHWWADGIVSLGIVLMSTAIVAGINRVLGKYAPGSDHHEGDRTPMSTPADPLIVGPDGRAVQLSKV